VASVLLVACSTSQPRPEGGDNARSRLSQLQSDPQLAKRAPVAINDAELAVRAAEESHFDKEQGDHLTYIANRKVDIARALAESRLLVDQRKMLSEQSEKARLASRTLEVDRARSAAASARMDTADARMERVAAEMENEALQREIAELNARATDRGLVVTLGDLLFATDKSELKGGAARNLSKLAAFLNKYKGRNVMIEGHTDNVGSDYYNMGLSQRRADSVKAYLVSEGIDTHRLVTSGKGEAAPVTGNGSASGRQQNRRVEVIIANVMR
jgi:outer membrane protein OmpA-like peptidoglycan-associated protein